MPKTTARSARLLGLMAVLVVSGLTASVALAAPPPAATLVGPAGVITGTTHAFTWNAADGATFYYLQVNDATASPRLTLWYPAAQACAGGSATCSVTLSTGFGAGAGIWWVQTWNPDGFGPWSAGMRFAVNHVPGAWSQTLGAADRFQLVLGSVAVLDRETGLVWERIPSVQPTYWDTAVLGCQARNLGGRLGWRLPSLEELYSLLDLTQANPALPSGHPFSIGSVPYWSATTTPGLATSAQAIDLTDGTFMSGLGKATNNFRWWCVRGGQASQNPQ
jgi:hypothetical protein